HLLTCEYLQKFDQHDWFYLDKWDRSYPKNQLPCIIKNNWDMVDTHLNIDIKQAYDFYTASDWFALRRGVKQRHLLPLRCELACSHKNFQIGVGQEYEWGNFELLQSEM